MTNPKTSKSRWWIEVMLGTKCNNRCVYCSTHEINIDAGRIKKEMLLARKAGIDAIAFSGGEPTLYNALFDYIAFAKKLGYDPMLVVTNGRIFSYESYCRKIIKSGVRHFLVSFQSCDKTIFELSTQSPGSFSQTVNGIKNLLKRNCEVYIALVITKYNCASLFETIKFLKNLGVKNIDLRLVRPEARAEHNYSAMAPDFSKLRTELNKIFSCGSFKMLTLSLNKIPFCLINEYHNIDILPTLLLPDINNWIFFDNQLHKKVSISEKIKKQLMKLSVCTSCRMKNSCPGVFKALGTAIGEERLQKELKPFTS